MVNSVPVEEVLANFTVCQKERGMVAAQWQKDFILQRRWRKETVTPSELFNGWGNFARNENGIEEKITWPESILSIPEIVQRIVRSDKVRLKALINEPLSNPPPIFVKVENGKYVVWDGVRRSLSAHLQNVGLEAFVGVLKDEAK